MSDVVLKLVGEGDLSRLEADLARLERRLEAAENRGRRAVGATAAGLGAAEAAADRARARDEVERARAFFDRLNQAGPLPPAGGPLPPVSGNRPQLGSNAWLFWQKRAAETWSFRGQGAPFPELGLTGIPTGDPRRLALGGAVYGPAFPLTTISPITPQPVPSGPRFGLGGDIRTRYTLGGAVWASPAIGFTPGGGAGGGGSYGAGGGSGFRGDGGAGPFPVAVRPYRGGGGRGGGGGGGGWADDDGGGRPPAGGGGGGFGAGPFVQYWALDTASRLAYQGVSELTEAYKRQSVAAKEARIHYDQMERTLSVSAGATPSELGIDAKRRIFELAQRYAVEDTYAGRVVDLSMRSGMDPRLAFGEGGLAVLDVATAMNATNRAKGEVSPEALLPALTGMLRGEGLPITPANIRRIGGMARAAYAGQMELSDLPDLARYLSALRSNGLELPESFSAMAALRDVGIPGPEASTGLRMITSNLRDAGASEAVTKELAKLGLTPRDIDLQGEDLATAMRRIDASRKKVDPVTFSQIMIKLFESRGRTYAETLMVPENLNRYEEYLTAMRDPKSLDRYVELATTGPAAAETRKENIDRASGLFHPERADQVALADAIQALQRAEGFSQADIDFRRWSGDKLAMIYDLFGMSTETAASHGLKLQDARLSDWFDRDFWYDMRLPSRKRAERARAELESGKPGPISEAWSKSLDRTNELLETIAKNTAKGPPPARPMPKPGTAEGDPR